MRERERSRAERKRNQDEEKKLTFSSFPATSTTNQPTKPPSQASGILAGFPVVDVTATLYDGAYHDVDSSVLAFQIAARQAFREGMRKGGARLLEPIMKVEVTTPEDHMGDVIGDLNSRRGLVAEFVDKPAGIKLIKASVPLSEMFQYVSTLRGMTKGRAQYTMQLEKYEVVPPNIQEKIVAASGGSKVTI